jgi:dTDP-4-amino-4,6-dideoxygalactose transaminase
MLLLPSSQRKMRNCVQKLEAEFAARFGFVGAVAAGFGRAALLMALRAVAPGLHAGDQVCVPNFICRQAVDAVRQAGAVPVFFPVRRDLTVDAAGFCSAFTSQTRAAIVAHYFGCALQNIAELAAVCRERGVPLIEDCAQALGARLNGRPAGTFGDVAVYSFTKSDWCYGGGMAATSSPLLLARLREQVSAALRPASWLCFQYGILRHADWLANRPWFSAFAGCAGRWLERWCASGQENFFDAGRYDVAMTELSARRAQQTLRRLAAVTGRRKRLLNCLRAELRQSAGAVCYPGKDQVDDSSAAFLLFCAPSGDAWRWRDRADESGVTLRLTWPAFQPAEPAQQSSELDWMARHLLVLEIHPGLRPAELRRIANAVRRLYQQELDAQERGS